MSQSHRYDPFKAVSQEVLAEVIASHEKLQQWNDATENALQSRNGEQLNAILVQNIRNTAAAILISGRSVSSQNFELLRALNLSDQTLSATTLASGFVAGALHEAASPIRTLAELQQPGDMRLEHAKERSEALENAIMQLGFKSQAALSGALQLADSAWEHPEKIEKTLSNSAQHRWDEYQQALDNIPKTLAADLTSQHAEHALGISFGVAAIGVIRSTVTASGRKMRDFSDQMTLYPDVQDIEGNKMHRVFYNPSEGHSINGYVDMQGQLHYHIIKSDGERYGHGDEMFASMIEKFRQHGVEVSSIRDIWRVNGRDSTNGQQYLDALAKGVSPEEAAFETFTGRQAKAMGMENVFVPPGETGSPFKPIFTKSETALQGQTARDVIVGHIRTLGLPPDKERTVIDHVEMKFGAPAPDAAPSR